jgi:D-alanyl-D-alanine dipeptidase
MLPDPPTPFQRLNPSQHLRIENNYATANNFIGKSISGYVWGDVWIHEEAYPPFVYVQESIQKLELTLVVWDAYRPYRATKQMVDWANATNQSWLVNEGYIAKRSRHNGGVAIDVGLMKEGRYLDMGTAWDDFSSASHIFNTNGDVLKNRLLLQGIMRTHGWVGYAKEWWHFELPNAAEYPILDIPYTSL